VQYAYYGSRSSWGSRRSNGSHAQETPKVEKPEEKAEKNEDWHYFRDEEGK